MLNRIIIEVLERNKLIKRYRIEGRKVKEETIQLHPITPFEKWKIIKQILINKLTNIKECIIETIQCKLMKNKIEDPFYVIVPVIGKFCTCDFSKADGYYYCTYNSKGKYIPEDYLYNTIEQYQDEYILTVWVDKTPPKSDITDYRGTIGGFYPNFSSFGYGRAYIGTRTVRYTYTLTPNHDLTITGLGLAGHSYDYEDKNVGQNKNYPVQIGYCDPDYATTCLILIWASSCEISLSKGVQYTINVIFQS